MKAEAEHLPSRLKAPCSNPHADKKENQVISTLLDDVQNLAQIKLNELINCGTQTPLRR